MDKELQWYVELFKQDEAVDCCCHFWCANDLQNILNIPLEYCGYCGHKFSKYVAKASSEKHSSASTQVCCPGCRNLLKTWD